MSLNRPRSLVGMRNMAKEFEMIPLCRGHAFIPGERNEEGRYIECHICGRKWTDEVLLRYKRQGCKID